MEEFCIRGIECIMSKKFVLYIALLGGIVLCYTDASSKEKPGKASGEFHCFVLHLSCDRTLVKEIVRMILIMYLGKFVPKKIF